MKRIYVESQGQNMEGTIFVPTGTGPFPGVLIFHGCSSNEKRFFDVADMLAAQGIFAMTVNLRGHGESEGVFSEMTGAESVLDGFAAYDYLVSRSEIDAKRVGICGGSYGGMIAANVAAERPVKSLILRAPATYTEKMLHTPLGQLMTEEKTKFFNLTESEVSESPAVKAIEKCSGTLLIMTSGNDDIIPSSIPKAFFDHATQAVHREIETLEGAPHSLTPSPVHKQLFNIRAVTWFSETL